jgi:hypothetical protein
VKIALSSCHNAPGDITATAHDRETTWLGLLPGLRLACGEIVHEALYDWRLTVFTGIRPSSGMRCRATCMPSKGQSDP